MTRHLATMALAIGLLSLAAQPAAAVTPNPLQDAYWRFEEGTNGSSVAANANVVLDSTNGNHLRADAGAEPLYTNVVSPLPLRSGLANNLALQFTGNPGGNSGDDVFTQSGEAAGPLIRNGMIGAPVAPDVTGFTLEAAFRADIVGGLFRGIVTKEGQPAGLLPTLALKVRGDNGKLQIELFDQAGVVRSIESAAAIVAGNWYAAAVVNDGSSMSLYLDSNDANGYVLQGTLPVSGALYQGTENDWNYTWAIGRAAYKNNSADWFDGIIDEVRLSNRALAPDEFLFTQIPEPSTIALGAFAMAGMLAHSRRRRATA